MVTIPMDELPDQIPYKYKKDTFVTCSCGTEAIVVNELYDESELSLTFWQYGMNFGSMAILMRLKYTWAALTGKPYVNEILLNKEQLGILINCLQERAKNIIDKTEEK